MGNRLTMNNAGLVTYTYDANNKLTQLVGPSGTTTFAYDNNGNTTQMATPGGTWTYGYDYENRLASVSGPGNYSAAYGYTPDGLRIRAQESNHANPDRWFQYDGVRPVLEGTLSGDTWSTLARYDFEGNSYYDPLVYTSVTGVGTRHHLYDGLGSTRQLMAHADQSITDTYTYEAFGNLLASTGSFHNPYRYVGSLGYYQTGSSLQHLGARYYLPQVGRFIAQDRIGAGMNWYAYADNSPMVFVDPTGMICWPGFLDPLQAGLDVAGLIPVIGEPVDLINAAISAGRGRWGEAGLGVVAAIPFVGWAGTAGKAGLRYSDDAAALVGLAKRAKRSGVTREEARILRQWADEYKVPSRGPEIHPRRPRGKHPHIHIGPVDHIPLR